MINLPNEVEPSKSTAWRFLEYLLLALCMGILSCRATIPEGLTSVLYAGKDIFPDVAYNVILSGLLVFAGMVWFILSMFRGRFRYRFSGMEWGFMLFVLGGCLSLWAASNKRLAINDFAVFAAIFVMGLLLVQLLDSSAKTKLVLYVIVALGVVVSYECFDQFFTSNRMVIEQYQQDPNAMLFRLGISPGSYQHMLFEYQLYSKDVRGFFMTGNSAGAFALLAIFGAIALFFEKSVCKVTIAGSRGVLLRRYIVTAFITFGLILTHSKGAIGGGLIALALFAFYFFAGDWLKRHWKIICVTIVLLAVAGSFWAVSYGLKHGRLPGGNSMLVRWQYWTATARMYAEHPFTGVGGANFANLYPRYKIPAAPETVKDPHNFILSVLAQYGPLGLAGFLSAMVIPAWRAFRGRMFFSDAACPEKGRSFRRPAIMVLIFIAAVLLIVRPVVMQSDPGEQFDVMIYVVAFLFVVPVIVFAAGFLVLSINEGSTLLSGVGRAALLCGLSGVMIHSCVDFAIFEPGVLGAFVAILAVLAASGYNQADDRSARLIVSGPWSRTIALAVVLVAGWLCFEYLLIPVLKSSVKIDEANKKVEYAYSLAGVSSADSPAVQMAIEEAHGLLREAQKDDIFSSKACALDGALYLVQLLDAKEVGKQLVESAEKSLYAAISRDNADFRNYEKLVNLYSIMAQVAPEGEEAGWLQKAYGAANKTVERFPGGEQYTFELARIAEKLGRTDVAVEQYRKTIQIEDSYRRQFGQMYAGRKLFSRLGEDKYQFSLAMLKKLTEKPNP